MNRVIFFISAIVIMSLFSSQLLALPRGAIARLGFGDIHDVKFSPDGKMLAMQAMAFIFMTPSHFHR